LQFLATVVPGGLPGTDQAQQPIAGGDPKASAPPPAYTDTAKALPANEFSPPPPPTSNNALNKFADAADAEGGQLTPAGESPSQQLLTPPPPNRLAERFREGAFAENNEVDARVAVAPQMFSAASPSAYVADRISANSPASSGLVPLAPRLPTASGSPAPLGQVAPEQLLATMWRQFGGTTIYDQTKSVLAIVGILAVLVVFWRAGRERESEHHED
jgi:hypothetical protein